MRTRPSKSKPTATRPAPRHSSPSQPLVSAHAKRFLATLFLVLLALPAAHAETRYLGDGLYEVGIPSWRLDALVSEQANTNWCYAAVGQDLLENLGIYVEQSQLVAAIFGTAVNRPATAEQIRRGLSGWQVGTYQTTAYFLNSTEAVISELTAGKGLLVGFNGHVYLLGGLLYVANSNGSIQPLDIVLRDPWPGRSGRIVMDWFEFVAYAPEVIAVSLQ